MGTRWKRSWAIAQQSLVVLRENPSLAWFPVISGLAVLVLTASFFVPIVLAVLPTLDTEEFPSLAYVLTAAWYFLAYFVVIFFNVGMAYCVHASLNGQKASFSDGIVAAACRIGPIFGWTLIASTVGILLSLVSERVGIVGKILVALLGGAWNLLTYFVLPIVALENIGPVTAVRQSASLFKRTWGEHVIGAAGVGLIVGAAVMIPLVPIVLAIFSGSITLLVSVLAIAMIYWIAAAILGASLGGIYQTALFVYAQTGAAAGGFAPELVASAFEPKRRDKVSGFVGRS